MTLPLCLTLAQSLRTYAAMGTNVSVTMTADDARKAANAIEAQENSKTEAVRIAHYNFDLFCDARADRQVYWQQMFLCAAAAAQFVRLFEALL